MIPQLREYRALGSFSVTDVTALNIISGAVPFKDQMSNANRYYSR